MAQAQTCRRTRLSKCSCDSGSVSSGAGDFAAASALSVLPLSASGGQMYPHMLATQSAGANWPLSAAVSPAAPPAAWRRGCAGLRSSACSTMPATAANTSTRAIVRARWGQRVRAQARGERRSCASLGDSQAVLARELLFVWLDAESSELLLLGGMLAKDGRFAALPSGRPCGESAKWAGWKTPLGVSETVCRRAD